MIPSDPDKTESWALLSFIPVPFWLSPQPRPHGVCFIEPGNASSRSSAFVAFVFLFFGASGVAWIALGVDTNDLRGVWTVTVFMLLIGVFFLYIGHRRRWTRRTLTLDKSKSTLTLLTTIFGRPTQSVELPIRDCQVRSHPVHFDDGRSIHWTGFAAIVHMPLSFDNHFFTFGVFKSESMARNCIQHLPPELREIDRGGGSRLRCGVVLKLASRRVRRASRGLCPECGYDLANLFAEGSRCPECGWSASRTS